MFLLKQKDRKTRCYDAYSIRSVKRKENNVNLTVYIIRVEDFVQDTDSEGEKAVPVYKQCAVPVYIYLNYH